MDRNVGGKSYGDILTQKRADDWIAYRRDVPAVWDAGKTEAEALGRLIKNLREQGYGIRIDDPE